MDKDMILRRLFAFLIDEAVASVGMVLLWCLGPGGDPSFLIFPTIRMAFTWAYWLGWLWMIGYSLLRDCLFARRSLGKLCMKLKVIDMQSQAKVSYKQLVLRNVTFPIMQVEAVVALVLRGKRLGDVLAKTKVVDRDL